MATVNEQAVQECVDAIKNSIEPQLTGLEPAEGLEVLDRLEGFLLARREEFEWSQKEESGEEE
jgi:hypothetical protein